MNRLISSISRWVLGVTTTFITSGLIMLAHAAPGDVMVTVAGIPGTGTGAPGSFSGDGGQAVNAHLYEPKGLVVDAGGNIYLADSRNQRIRRIDKLSGIITTIAGTGTAGFSGDGQQASVAMVSFPQGLAFDAAGNLFITDTANHRIRIITAGANGTIEGSDTMGTVYGNGATAVMNAPADIGFDGAGNLYIADELNHRILKRNTSGGVSTVAGTGLRPFNGDSGVANSINIDRPRGVAVDAAGNLYFSDSGNLRLRRVAPGANGTIDGTDQLTSFTVGGFGTPPLGVNIDGAGHPAVADGITITSVNPATGAKTVVAGGGSFSSFEGLATSMRLKPWALTFDETGDLVVADYLFHMIRKVTADSIAPTGTVSINSGAALTNSLTVTLTPTCSDNSLICAQMNVSNDGVSFTTQPYPRFFPGTVSWTMDAGPDGVRTVSIQVVDTAGNPSATVSDSIMLDTMEPLAPVITSPADGSATNNPIVTVEGTTEAGAGITVTGDTFGVATADEVGAWNFTTGVLADGQRNITATATDLAGNSGPSSAIVITIDTIAPVVTPPENIIVAAVDATGTPGSDTTITAFLAAATATDAVSGMLTPTNNAPATFPLGATSVTFTATDAAGNLGTGMATVTATDQTAPVVSAPENLTVAAASPAGTPATDPAIMDFLATATASDNVDGAITPLNNAPTVFPLGPTPVVFSALDAAGNSGFAAAILSVSDSADLEVIKLANQNILAPGDPVTYMMTITNLGPSDVTGALVQDTLPPELPLNLIPSWNCLPGMNASCTSSGTGNINDSVNIPFESSVSYTLTAATDPGFQGIISNTVTVTAPVDIIDPVQNNNNATVIVATQGLFMDGFEEPLGAFKRWLERVLEEH